MKTWIYWFFASGLLALVVHLFIVIFVPGVDTGQKMAQFASAADVNRFHQISQASPATLVTEANPDLAYAFCTFDLTSSALEIEARIPPTYWSMSVYTETADNIYTLNDRQAGVDAIKLLVVRDGVDVELQNDVGERDENTILVRSPTAGGLVLFRAFLGDGSLEARVRDYFAGSGCAERDMGHDDGPVVGQFGG